MFKPLVVAGNDRVGLAFLDGVFEQRCAAEDSMGELAVGHGQEKRHDQTEMNSQHQAQGAGFSKRQKRQAACANQKQQRDETAIHRLLILVTVCGVAAQVQPEQTCRANQQTDTTDNAQHHRQAEDRIRGRPIEQIVKKRGHTRGGEAQHETVEGEVVEATTPEGELIVGVVAALTMATVQIFEFRDVGRSFQCRGRSYWQRGCHW